MISHSYLALILLVLLAIGAFRIHMRIKNPPQMRDRDDLPVREIRTRFYPALNISQELFEMLWKDVAESFLIPAGKMRPDDRFGFELPFTKVISDEDMFLGEALYRRMEEFGLEEPVPPMERVDDYIRFLTGFTRE